jgi:hypothetical protein
MPLKLSQIKKNRQFHGNLAQTSGQRERLEEMQLVTQSGKSCKD